jgi:uncharacterized protein (DUF1800 family)
VGSLTAEVAVDKLTFGPAPGLVDHVRSVGVADWVEQQLTGAGLADAESMVSAYQTLTNSNLQNYQVAQTAGGSDLMMAELDMATILRSAHSEHQLFELMSDFWSNHFSTWRNKTWMGFLKNQDHLDVVRAHALGKFSDLLSASTHSPAMLDFLDNLSNDASSPGGVNENYAREVMELHTLGIIDGQAVYTEDDVHQVAKIVSGWSIDWSAGSDQYEFLFAPWMHSLDAVSVLGGAFSRPARSYGQGYDDGVAFFDVLAHHPSTARYISYKLARRFVSDTPPMTLVDAMAQVFLDNDTAIVPVLRHLFASPEFAASGGAKVRRPFEHLVAGLRSLGATTGTDPSGPSADALRASLDNMGQPLFERTSPDGYPDIGSFWVSSAGLLERWAATGNVARNALSSQSDPDAVTVALSAQLPSPLPGTVADLISWLGTNAANISIPAGDIGDMCTAIGVAPTGAATTLSTNTSRLGLAVGLILCHPSFQRR